MRPVDRVACVCEVCGSSFEALQSHINRGRGRFCSSSCRMTATQAARWERQRATRDLQFWARVDQSGGPDACWPWTGNTIRAGYGRFVEDGIQIAAHRRALALSKGPPPEGLPWALHDCDNPPCCNGGHLYWGTPTNNMQDRGRRSRWVPPHRKLDPEAAAALHADGQSYSQIAAAFGVNQATVGKALKRRALVKALIAQQAPA